MERQVERRNDYSSKDMSEAMDRMSSQIAQLRFRLQMEEERANTAEEQLGIWRKLGQSGPQGNVESKFADGPHAFTVGLCKLLVAFF
jgi:hypothetical protein